MKKWFLGIFVVLILINTANYFSVKAQIPSIISNIINEHLECEEYQMLGATMPISYLYATKYESTVFLQSRTGNIAEVTAEALDTSSPLVRFFGTTNMKITILGSEFSKISFCKPKQNG